MSNNISLSLPPSRLLRSTDPVKAILLLQRFQCLAPSMNHFREAPKERRSIKVCIILRIHRGKPACACVSIFPPPRISGRSGDMTVGVAEVPAAAGLLAGAAEGSR